MFKSFFDKFKHALITLRFSILTIFITLFLLITMSIIGAMSTVFSKELTYIALTIMDHVSNSVLRELNKGMRPAEINAQFSANLFKSGIINDEDKLVKYTYYMVKTMPLVVASYWADEEGNVVVASKQMDGSITSHVYDRSKSQIKHTIITRDVNGNVIERINSPEVTLDPRKRPWYIEAKEKKKTIWTDLFKSFLNPYRGIATITPIYNDQGQLLGAFGFDVSTDYLVNFLTQQKVSKNGYAFIVTKNKELIAYPARKSLTTDKFITLPYKVNAQSLPIIDQSLDRFNKTGENKMRIKFQGHKYLVTFQLVKELAEHGWLIGVIIPEDDFLGILHKINSIVLLFCFLILLLGILIVSELISRIVRPINALVKETEKIKHFDLRGDITIPSRIKEVVKLRDAIRSMKIGLKQFQKYVPKILVRQLIESGEDLRVGGERKELVVLFSDIENFTTIAEKMDPNQLMAQVCEYFEALTQIIIKHKGTIDKYIGDSIMAFWGAPLQQSDPCGKAANAALECESILETLNARWVSEGKPRLVTRIGIHIGEAIVGNLGSSERLNYTAIGDTINISSRLEHINKTYHTKIMVSEQVYTKIKDRFVLRKVDYVVVVGRTEALWIYELMGDNPKEIPFDIVSYNENFNQGLKAYQEKRFAEAINFFKKCLAIYPEDTVAPIFIERCKQNR